MPEAYESHVVAVPESLQCDSSQAETALVRGVFRPESVAYHQRAIGRMQQAGCDAVVLGCTELPLILGDANSPLPTLDSTRLLARAALRRACSCE
jgi:aspartate/glutamate racemase